MAGGGPRGFADRMDVLIEAIHEAGQDRLPGDRRYANRRRSAIEGVPPRRDDLERLRQLAQA